MLGRVKAPRAGRPSVARRSADAVGRDARGAYNATNRVVELCVGWEAGRGTPVRRETSECRENFGSSRGAAVWRARSERRGICVLRACARQVHEVTRMRVAAGRSRTQREAECHVMIVCVDLGFFAQANFLTVSRGAAMGMAAARAGRSDPRSDRYAGCACVRRAWTGTDRARGALGPRIADRGPPGPGVVNRTRPGATGTARATDPHVCHVTPKAPRQRHHPAPPCTPLRNWAAAGSFRTIPCDGTQTICGAPHAAVNACRTKPIRVAASRTPKLTVYSPAAAWRMPSSPTSESSASVG